LEGFVDRFYRFLDHVADHWREYLALAAALAILGIAGASDFCARYGCS